MQERGGIDMELVIILIILVIVGCLIYKTNNRKELVSSQQSRVSDTDIYEAKEIKNTELFKTIAQIITRRNMDMIHNDVFSRNLNVFSNIVYTNIVVTEDRVAKLETGGSTGWPDELTHEILFKDFGYQNLNSHQVKIFTIALGMMMGYKYECENDNIKVLFVESYWHSIFQDQKSKRDKKLKSL